MNIIISPSLKQLAKAFENFGSPLYIVGGYVRNAVLGFYDTDIDLASPLTPEQVFEALQGSGFSATEVNPKLGTLLIKSRFSGEFYEYTPFRSEEYSAGGHHSPNKISFVTDIKQDASRRDFTANCIYYNILSREITDLYGGVGDIKNKLLKCVETPEFVFNVDGLRILRLVRMGAELSFELEKNTFKVAKEKISNLKHISRERFHKELSGMLFSDFKYPKLAVSDLHIKAANNLTRLGAWGYVFPELLKMKGVNEEKLNGLDEGFCKLLKLAPPQVRFAALLSDLAAALGLTCNAEYVKQMLGANGLMFNNNDTKEIITLFSAERQVRAGFVSAIDEMLFIINHKEILPRLLEWLKLHNLGQDIDMRHKIMIVENVPRGIKELKINGDDIIKNFPNIRHEDIGIILNELLLKCLKNPELNKKGRLIKLIKKQEV